MLTNVLAARKERRKLNESVITEGIHDPSIFKAVFLAGGPASGKDYVMKRTMLGLGLVELNTDRAFTFLLNKNKLSLRMPESERAQRDIHLGRAWNITVEQQRLALVGRLGLIINGTAAEYEKIATIKTELEKIGYETLMVFVDTQLETAIERNKMRGASGDREVPRDVQVAKWQQAQQNKSQYQNLFGNKNFIVVNNNGGSSSAISGQMQSFAGNTRSENDQFLWVYRRVRDFVSHPSQNQAAFDWLSRERKRLGLREGAIKLGGKNNGANLDKFFDEYHATTKPHPFDDHSRIINNSATLELSKFEGGAHLHDIRSLSPKSGAGTAALKHLISLADKHGIKIEGTAKTYHNDPRYISSSKRLRDWYVKNGFTASSGNQSDGYSIKYTPKKAMTEGLDAVFESYLEGTDELVQAYKAATPGQPIGKTPTVIKPVVKPPAPVDIKKNKYKKTQTVSEQTLPKNKSIQDWATSPKTQALFAERYGDDADNRLKAAANRIDQCLKNKDIIPGKKSIAALREEYKPFASDELME